MSSIVDWVAPNEDTFAAVVGPIEVDENAKDDLLRYHPFDSKHRICKFQLQQHVSSGSPIAKVFVPHDADRSNWQTEFLDLLDLLQFKLVHDKKIGDMLLDTRIGEQDQPEMGKDHKWRVTRWQIVRAEVDPKTLEVILFKEGIFWETLDGSQKAFSTYAWKPYRPAMY